MSIWESNCILGIIGLQDTIGFQDIYRKRDGKWLLDSIGICDSKFAWYIRWLQDILRFQDNYRERNGK